MSSLKHLLISMFIFFFLISCSYPISPMIRKTTPEKIDDISLIKSETTVPHEAKNRKTTKESFDAKICLAKEEEEREINESLIETGKVQISRTNTISEEEQQLSKEVTVDEALKLIGQSQNLWEEGDLDSALSLLDEAYSYIIEVNGDPEISWQKDDLRFIIAKRIMEIYTSRKSVAVGKQSEIPLVVNNDVNKEIERFVKTEKRYFLESCRRSSQYRPTIVNLLKEAGLPEELSWLPLVESGFRIKALSKARALGLWQFIPSTGYKYGLKRDLWIDERMDVEKSTKAAIAYLKDLHEIFGDWLTVLAAYNCGEGRVLRAISRQHMNYLDNFWDLYRQLPYETARYVPRFLAVLHLVKNGKNYGFDLQNDYLGEPKKYEVVTIDKSMQLKDIAKNMNMDSADLEFLNSELRYKVTPDKNYCLKVPYGMGEQLESIIASVPTAKRPGGPEFIRHKIRSGESLSVIAGKYKTSIRAIASINNLTSTHKIRAGKWLKIPVRGYAGQVPEIIQQRNTTNTSYLGLTYKVKQGDSLWVLARRFNTTVTAIKRTNNLNNNNLKIGQLLKIGQNREVCDAGSASTYVVKKGDTPYIIAQRNNMQLNELLQINNFEKNTVIYPNQKIIIKN